MHHPKRPLLIRAPPACYPAYPLRWAVHNAVCPLASVINHRSSGSRPVCPETARHHCAAATGSWGPMTLDGACRFCLASRLEYQSLGPLRRHTVRATCSWPPERTKKPDHGDFISVFSSSSCWLASYISKLGKLKYRPLSASLSVGSRSGNMRGKRT